MHRMGMACVVASMLLVLAETAPGGVFTATNYPAGAMNDTNVGLSTNHHYTIAADVIDVANTTVNGVLFTSSGTVPYGADWSLAGANSQYTAVGGSKGNVTGAITNLFNRFQYGGNPGFLILSNLVAGQVYAVTLYCQTWSAGGRTQTVTGSSSGQIAFDEDAGGGSLLRYTFAATNATESIRFAPWNTANTFHFYGFTSRRLFNNQWNIPGGGSFNDPASWSRLDAGTAFGAPVAADLSAAFPAAVAPVTVTVDANTTLGHLEFDGANPYTLATTNASSMALEAGPAGLCVLAVPSGTHAVSVPVALNHNAVKLGAGSLVVLADISGAGGLGVRQGVLSLAGTNSHAGRTVVSGGTLDVQAGTALSSASVLDVTAPATIVLSNGVNATVASFVLNGFLQEAGTWGATGSGATHINDSVFAGPGVISAATGVVTADGSWSANTDGPWGVAANWTAGTIAYGTNSTAYFTNAITAGRIVSNSHTTLAIGHLVFGSPANNWTLAGSPLELVVAAGSPGVSVVTNGATISAALSGTQGLEKTGGGSLALVGTNTYTGGTAVRAGRLQIGANGTSGSVSGAITNDAMLAFARSDSVTFPGVIAGTGAVISAGSGVIALGGANTFTGPLLLTNGTLAISQDANLGAAGSGLGFNGGTLRVTGTAVGTVDARAVNWSTFAGGLDIADAAHAFTLGNAIGGITAGNFTKYGAGSLVFTNAPVRLQNILFQQGPTFVESGSVVTGLGYISIGQLVKTSATVTLRGTGRLVSQGDLNLGDLAGSTGIVTVAGAAQLGARTLYVGKGGNGVGVLNVAGGSVVSSGTTDWRIGGGNSTNDRAAYGYVRQTDGTFYHPQNMQLGAYGMAQWDLLGGTFTNNAGAPVVGRYPGSLATFNINGGRYTSVAWGFLVGEQGEGVVNVANGTMDVSGGGNGFAIGGWQGNGDQGTGTVNLASGGLIVTRFVRKGATNASYAALHFDGGTLRAAQNTTTFLQGLDAVRVGPGGAVFDAQDYNITVAQPLLAPTGDGATGIVVTNGGSGYVGPPVVRIAGGGGSGATAYAQIDGGAGTVTNIVITSPGVDFISSPAVTLNGGGGNGAGLGTVALAANTAGGGLAKRGAGTLALTATNTYGGDTVIEAGILLVGTTNAAGTGGIVVTTNTAGIGSAYPMDQNFIHWLTTRLDGASSSGVLALGAGTTNEIDLSALAGWTLGAAGGSYLFEGVLLNAGTNLFLGGGNGTLTYVPTIGTGTNVFAGVAGQNPAGVVVLAGTNDAYAGTIIVRGGTLRGGRTNAFGGAAAVVRVGDGTVLDVGGQPLGAVPVFAEGRGINGSGAIVNSGATQINALENVTLTGDATFGGPNRWDIRGTNLPAVLDLAGFTLTKTNGNYIALHSVTVGDGDIDVGQGTLSIENATTVTGGVGTITVGPAGTLNFWSLTGSMDRPVSVQGGTIAASAGASVIDSIVTLAGPTNTFNTGGFTLVLNGLVDGAGALLKTGGGSLVLPAATAYTGGTIVNGGVLVLNSPDPLQGTITSGGSLTINGGAALAAVNEGVFGTNALPITIRGGSLTTSNEVFCHIRGPLTLAGGSLGGGTPNPTNGCWILEEDVAVLTNSWISAARLQLGKAGGVAFDVAAGAKLTVVGTCEDPGMGAGGVGTLIKRGAGTMVFGQTNAYSGATIVSNGVVRLGGTIPGGVVARYTLDGNTDDVSGNGNNGALVGAGSSYVAGQFGQALSLTGSQYVQVPYNASLGLTNFTVSAWINYSVTPGTYGIVGTRFGGDYTFDLKYQNSKIHADVGNGTVWLTTTADANITIPSNSWHMVTYVVTNNGCQIYLDAALVNSIAFAGTPLLMKPDQTMGVGNSYTTEYLNGLLDDVNVYGRGLTGDEITRLFMLGGGGATNILPRTTPLLLAAGTVLDLNGSAQELRSLSGSGLVTNEGAIGAVVSLGGGTGVFSGVLSDGAGSVALGQDGAGVQTLHGSNPFSGGVALSNGLLLVNGALTGTGTVTITGGTLGGTGRIAGLVLQLGGTVAPGASPGALTLLGDYAQGGDLAVEISGTAPGGGYDQLIVGGAASLFATLTVTTNGYAPVDGDSFTILTASNGVSGSFAFASLPPLSAPELGWKVDYQTNAVVLSVTSAPPATTGYDLFAGQIPNAADRGYQNDPDGDGYANLLEYVTGGNPTNADIVAQMKSARTNGVLALKFSRSIAATDATLYVEGSYATTNDATWTGIATNLAGSWGGAPNVSEAGGPDPVNVTVEDTVSPATNRFLRLRVTRP